MVEDRIKEALELARGSDYTNLATEFEGQPFIRLMHWSRIEDDFTVWLSTKADSAKVRHIESNPKVCAIFTEEVGYVRVFGIAEIVDDKEKRHELWEDQWYLFWPKGADDPGYRLIKITPTSVDYLNMARGDLVAKPLL